MPPLNSYLKLLKNNTTPFPCPHCQHFTVAEHFEDHCFVQHGLNPDVTCVWCFGHTFWPDTEKNHHVDHLMTCYTQFLPSQERPVTVSPQLDTPTLFDLTPLCEERQYDHHIPLPHLPDTPVWELEPRLHGLSFRGPRLNEAVALLQLYLQTQHHSDWHHVLVRPSGFSWFVKALDADAGKTHTLPFTCFCDGGGVPHRHFVLTTTPRGSFLKNTWKKMKCPQKASCLKQFPISSPMDLVHLLVALSQPRSQCRFTSYPLQPSLEPVGEVTQYYIARSLPAFSKIVLALQWKGGLLALLHQIYATVEPQVLAPVALSFHGLVGIRVCDLPGLWKNWVLPVSPQFRPTEHSTDYYVYLFQDRKLFFELCEEPLPDWEKVQADHGNVFFQAIGEALYFPTPYQQKCIHLLKPLIDKLVVCQGTVDKTQLALQEAETSLTRVQKLNHFLKRKYNHSERQLKMVQGKLIQHLEMENEALRKECFKKSKTDSSFENEK